MPTHLTKIPTVANFASLPSAASLDDGYPTAVGADLYLVDSGAWVVAGRPAPDSETATATLPDVAHQVVLADATSGVVTLTLPAQVAGRTVTVKKVDATANVVISPASGNVDGAASKTLTTQYEVARLISDGTNWWLI